ncbi:hypothetical protein JAAARDRAFT_136126 [Jaapia argillacea MUCL 33604]|uniref:AMP-dependent synthetase/ligase domain-containing protein n=1 Tax=Jaapia argillacea MUCL 33604 TaxID=933084 RepID=A0A067PV01_9AGAM|nr:hypothetical protein JAAARDRAFT_136126 [Jaapia argillacea MUCL 33604]
MFNHLQVLDEKVVKNRSKPLFKLPKGAGKSSLKEWDSVSYETFGSDVNSAAKHVWSLLSAQNMRPGEVVGVWVKGDKYEDIVTIVALSRAGYVPQLISICLEAPEAVNSLLSRGGVKVLIYDDDLLEEPAKILVHSIPTSTLKRDSGHPGHRLESLPDVDLPSISTNPDDPAFIIHTSGSSGAGPKLVWWSNRWVDSAFQKSSDFATNGPSQDVWPIGGKLCHISGLCQYFSMLYNDACMLLQPGAGISADVMEDFFEYGGINCLFIMVPRLRNIIQAARDPHNPSLLKKIQNLRLIITSGSPLHEDEAAWCHANHIPLVVGLLLNCRKFDHPNHLQGVPGVSYRFLPFLDEDRGLGLDRDENDEQLYEFVVLPDSPEVPDRSLWKDEGWYGTGDIFEEVGPDTYVYRGRKEEWIVNDNGERCDTKIIEDELRKSCPDLIHDCIVVGNNRPSASVIVESHLATIDACHDEVKTTILDRTKDFNNRRQWHERVAHRALIHVVGPETLPRTGAKGNIRRMMTEQTFARELDHMYSQVYPVS